MSAKAELRARMRTVRESIDPSEREGLSRAACERIMGLPAFRQARVIGIYVAFGAELSLETLVRTVASHYPAKQLVAPVSMRDHRMEFVRVTPEETLAVRERPRERGCTHGSASQAGTDARQSERPCEESDTTPPDFLARPWRMGGMPPGRVAVPSADIDLLVIPGLAFDRMGRRLGYGGGFYDAYVSRARDAADEVDGPGAASACYGVCFDEQLVGRVPTGETDQPMDAVITPSQVLLV